MNHVPDHDGTLIMLGDYYGSLAAARCLGGVDCRVIYADHRRLVPGVWSRFVDRRVVCPSLTDLRSHAEWLIGFGKDHPGLFLYPVSDDHVWIMATRQTELEKHFLLYQPPLESTYALLNKKRLFRKAHDLAVPVPRTWFPSCPASVREIAPQLSYPVLIKPCTQIGFASKTKGSLCHTSADLETAVDRFRTLNRYDKDIVAYDGDVAWPMVQEYLPAAMTDAMSIAGFVDKTGRLSAFRASRKVFQRPRRLGIGVGFEACPVPSTLAERVLSICRATGYFGAFEVEFILDQRSNEFVLTDFNPRYYGQMAFEIARGLPLPLLVWQGARGDEKSLAASIQAARKLDGSALATQSIYAQSWVLRLLLITQGLGGKMSREERAHWRRWLSRSDRARFDALDCADDPWPLRIDQLVTLKHALRHPRDFWRKFFVES